MIRLRSFLFISTILFSVQIAYAQVSLVPVTHQVYEWLHMQRVKGNITNYSYEALPLTRNQINHFLDQLAESEDLNRIDKQLLTWYVQEFSLKQLEVDTEDTYLQGWEDDILSSAKRKVDLLLSNREPHLYAQFSNNMHWVMDYSFGGGNLTVSDPINNYYQPADIQYNTLRTYGTFYDMFGGHLELSNPYSFTEGQFRYHPEWGQTFDGGFESKQATFYVQAFASFQYKSLGLHVGNGDIKVGYRGTEAPILRQEAGNFDWLRLNFDTKYVQFIALHGALQAPTTRINVDGYPGVTSNFAPERWFALRRIQITPAHWITMAFTESLTYSNRPVELSYLNPVLPLRFAEFENRDRDNPIWWFDGSLRPLNNLELYATIGIDDLLSFSSIWDIRRSKPSPTNKISYQAGLNYTLPTSTQINVEAIQFDPYFYTHKYLLNTYDELGSPLGSSIGPNSQQLFVSIRQWLPWRSFIDLSFARSKKGLNILDENGILVRDVGGDLFNPQVGELVSFMNGEIHRWNSFRIQFEFEPIRGIRVFADFRRRIMFEGTQIENFGMFTGGLEVYFYPGVATLFNKVPVLNKAF